MKRTKFKETAIRFTPENAQKIQDGTKTQTRRIVQNPEELARFLNPFPQQAVLSVLSPYGMVEDRLYVVGVRGPRLWMELTDVRVERVQDISETDAIAEGCVDAYGPDFHAGAFRKLWESIHGPGSWDRNPWVWVLEFKRLQR